MALDARIHFKSFVRINKNPTVCPDDWARVFKNYQLGLNFDGELWGLGNNLEELIQIGFRGPEEQVSECSWNSSVKGYAEWLRKVRVTPNAEFIKPFDAWTVEGSTCNFVQCQWSDNILVKNLNCTWDYY